MTDLLRILLLLALGGAVMTALGSAAAWWREEDRRLRRMLRRALQAPAEMVIIAKGRGLAAGFNLAEGRVAVLWDDGLKGLVYRLHQLVGAELIVDDQVAARAFRGEPRRPLDQIPSEAKRVMLRLVFDNARDPDFELPLWPPADAARPGKQTAFEAIQAARRWVSSVEALLRKSPPPAPPAAAPVVAERPQPAPVAPAPLAPPRAAPAAGAAAAAAAAAAAPDLFEDRAEDPPWDDDDDDQDAEAGSEP